MLKTFIAQVVLILILMIILMYLFMFFLRDMNAIEYSTMLVIAFSNAVIISLQLLNLRKKK